MSDPLIANPESLAVWRKTAAKSAPAAMRTR